jgi:HK97 family phage major capsid protein
MQRSPDGRRALDGISIGFLVVEQDRRGDTRVVSEAELWEISVVTFPADLGARVRSVSKHEPAGVAGAQKGDGMSQSAAPAVAPEATSGSQEPTKLAEQIAKETYAALRPLLERAEAERKSQGEIFGETKESIERVQDRLDALETQFARQQIAPSSAGGRDPEAAERAEAFRAWMRAGVVPPEKADMLVADPATGGFLAPNEFEAEVIKGIVEFSPMREVARIRQTGARAVVMPKRTQVGAATWVSEQGARDETQNPAYGQEEIPTHELHARADVSSQDLEDTVVDLDAELREDMAEQFGVAESAAFVAGNGVGKPAGFLSHPDIATVNSGSASAVTADGLIDLFYALKESYARNATWLMRRSTVRDIRKLKDGQGQYLWQPGLAGVAPATILDRPYLEAVDMPAVQANARAIAIGDWRRGYVIVDRIAMQMQRDPYTRKGFVVMTARRRVGGQVILPEAIKIQTIAS